MRTAPQAQRLAPASLLDCLRIHALREPEYARAPPHSSAPEPLFGLMSASPPARRPAALCWHAMRPLGAVAADRRAPLRGVQVRHSRGMQLQGLGRALGTTLLESDSLVLSENACGTA